MVNVMRVHNVVHVIAGSSAAILFLIMLGAIQPSLGDEIPAEVRAAIEANAKSLSPLSASWERTRSSDLPSRQIVSVLKEQPGELAVVWTTHFIWDQGKFYCSERASLPAFDQSKDGGFVVNPNKPRREYWGETAFNGEKRYNGNKSPMFDAPHLVIESLDKLASRRPSRFVSTEFFREAGFHLPDRPAEYQTKEPAKSLLLYLVDHGAKVVEVGRKKFDDANCATVLLDNGDRQVWFALDEHKNYAVRQRVESTKADGPAVKVVCSEFERPSASEFWMPRRIVVEWHTWRESLVRPIKDVAVRETYKVLGYKMEVVRDDQFVLGYGAAGTYISDDANADFDKPSAGPVTYRVPANPKDLDAVIKAATPRGAASRSRLPVLFVLNVVAVFAIIAIAAWRKSVARRPGRAPRS